MPRIDTPFRVSTHGYKFRNHFEGMFPALCGGMALSSLDYYYNGLRIPPDAEAPTFDGGTNPLYSYILKRQNDAHRHAIPRLMDQRSETGTNSVATSATTAFTWLKSWIDRHAPVPILLGDRANALSDSSHWVVAIGYETGSSGEFWKVHLYDNNYPGRDCNLRLPPDSPDGPAGELIHSLSDRTVGFYIPYLGYTAEDPRRHRGEGWALAGSAPIEGI